jgi:DNA-binding CsgD family transcriptional regulator
MTTVSLIGDDAEARARVREALESAGIQVIAEGESVDELAEHRADVVVIHANGTRDDDGVQEAMTAREQEVLELLAEGLSNRRTAERLGISEHTVKFHVASIYGKLGAASRAEAIRLAARRGLIRI